MLIDRRALIVNLQLMNLYDTIQRLVELACLNCYIMLKLN
jgi:hypothetical protein